MEFLKVKGKIPFTECLRTLLFQSYGNAEAETYAFYQHHCSFMFKVKADVVNHNPHYYRLHEVILKFESIYHNHPDIDFFEIVHKKSGDEVRVLSRSHFREWSQEIYENEGRRRVHNSKELIGLAYVSENFLDSLEGETGPTLFHKTYRPNPFASQFVNLYQSMKRKNYHLSAETTVKEFYRDIIRDLYPQASVHDQKFFRRFFETSPPSSEERK